MRRGLFILTMLFIIPPITPKVVWAQNNSVQLSGDEMLVINTLTDGTTIEGQSTNITWRNNRIFTNIVASLDAPPPVTIRLRAEQFQGTGWAWCPSEITLEAGNPQTIIAMLLSGSGQATLHYTLDVPRFMAPGIYTMTVNYEITR